MQDNRHRVVEVPELLTSVAYELDQRQRLHLMLVSKHFFRSVGPVIWKSVPRLDILLKLIRDTNVTYSRFVDSRGAHFPFTKITSTLPNQLNLTRFDVYAPWVQHLEIFGGAYSQDIRNVRPLLNILAQRPLLPNLRRLTAHTGAEIESARLLGFINLFFYPTLTEIRTILHEHGHESYIDPTSVPSFLQKVHDTCPRIQALEFYPQGNIYEFDGPEKFYIPGDEYRTTLGSFSNLRSFSSTIFILQPKTFSVLGGLPYLESLGILGDREDYPVLNERMTVPETWFPSLKHLQLRQVHPQDITTLWSQPPIARKLVSASIHCDPTAPLDQDNQPTDENNWVDMFIMDLLRRSPNMKKLALKLEDEDGILGISQSARDALQEIHLDSFDLATAEEDAQEDADYSDEEY